MKIENRLLYAKFEGLFLRRIKKALTTFVPVPLKYFSIPLYYLILFIEKKK